jgi:hypothetical protein
MHGLRKSANLQKQNILTGDAAAHVADPGSFEHLQ